MRHAHDDQQLSAPEQDALQQIQSGPTGGSKVPVTKELLSWLSGIQPARKSTNQNGEGNSVPDAAKRTRDAKQETVEGDVFVKSPADANDVDINDVKQGRLGDCYFLAVLAAIARVRPDFIKSMVKDNGNGTYTVKFHTEQGISGLFGSRSDKSVTVDRTFWTDGKGTPEYANKGDVASSGSPELWVMVIEKAWAKLHGGHDDIEGGKVHDDARDAVTGGDGSYIDPTYYSDAKLAKKLEDAFKAKHPVVFWSLRSAKKLDKSGVIANHEYALNAAAGGKFTLYNPWGTDHLENVDAAFIKANFQRVRFLDL